MESIGVSVAISNPFNQPETFDLVFKVPESEIQEELTGTFTLHNFEGMTGILDAATLTRPIPETAITDEGTVVLEMSNELYEKWVQGGKQGSGFVEIKSPLMDKQVII
ncbi:MAG: hypothetical protein ACI865_002954 [Flavobacteriaceae bacterium]|jgi:hypothetical protein